MHIVNFDIIFFYDKIYLYLNKLEEFEMTITNKLGEQDITDAVLYVLLEANSSLDTATVKSMVRSLLDPAGSKI